MARPRAPPPLPACLGPPSSTENGHAEAGPFGLAHTSTRLTPKHGDPEAGDPEACVPRKDPESEGVAVGAAHTERERKGGRGGRHHLQKNGVFAPFTKVAQDALCCGFPGSSPFGVKKARFLGTHVRFRAPQPCTHARSPL